MKKIMKLLSAILTIGLLNGLCSIPAIGSATITGISLHVTSNVVVTMEKGAEVVEISTSNPNFTIKQYAFLNDISIWGYNDTPRLKIDIEANEGYQFANLTTEDVSLSNSSAAVDSISKDGNEKISITLRFKPLSQSVGTPTKLQWTSTGRASWDAVPSASGYDVRLYRGNTMVGELYHTTNPYFDFGVKMSKPGSYFFWVRARQENNSTIKSDYAKSRLMEVDMILGNALKNKTIGWYHDESGWWYRNADGSYHSNGWKEIDGVYYYFNETGYLLVNTTTPDGYLVDETGRWLTDNH